MKVEKEHDRILNVQEEQFNTALQKQIFLNIQKSTFLETDRSRIERTIIDLQSAHSPDFLFWIILYGDF